MACPCTAYITFGQELLPVIRKQEEYKTVKEWLNEDLANLYGQCCGTILYLAVKYNNLEIVRYLIQIDRNLDRFGPDGKTPLALAVELNNATIVRALLFSNKTNMHIVNSNGLTALQMAFTLRHIGIVIMDAFFHKLKTESDTIEVMIDKLLHVGCTLHHAVLTLNTEVLEALLQRGYNVNSRNHNGKTALYVAAQENELGLAKLLLEHNACANVLDKSGTGPLFYAAWNRNLPMVAMLLERGADPNSKNKFNGYTPLLGLFAAGKIKNVEKLDECAKILLQHGAIPKNTIRCTKTILEYASEFYKSKGIHYLIAHIAVLDMSKKSTMSYNNVSDPDMVLTLERIYVKCRKILKSMHFKKASLLDLLANNEPNLRSRMRNETFGPQVVEEIFQQNLKDLHPYYYDTLMKRIKKAQRTMKLEDEAILVICGLLKKGYNECYLFAREIVSYLCEYDLLQLCQVQVDDDSENEDECKSVLKAMSRLSLRGFRVRPY